MEQGKNICQNCQWNGPMKCCRPKYVNCCLNWSPKGCLDVKDEEEEQA